MSGKNYKAFLFSHTALKSICSGVQNAHLLPRMFMKFPQDSVERTVLEEWSRDHETIVMRDGGISKSLKQIRYITGRACPVVGVPYATFYESEDYLDRILTSVGFILDRSRTQQTIFQDYSVDLLAKHVHNRINETKSLQQQEAYDILVALIDATRPVT